MFHGAITALTDWREPLRDDARALRAPLAWIIVALGLLTAAHIVRLGIGAHERHQGMASPALPPPPVTVAVGPAVLSIPANALRGPAPGGGSGEGVELRVHWPTLEGFTEARAEAFGESDPRSSIVHIAVRPAVAGFSPNERYDHVYRRLLTDLPRVGPGGLIAQTFRSGFGYDGETLYVSPGTGQPVVARCTADEESAPGSCLVEFRSAHGIDVAYRFRRSLLSRWRAVDRSVRDLIAGYVVAPRD